MAANLHLAVQCANPLIIISINDCDVSKITKTTLHLTFLSIRKLELLSCQGAFDTDENHTDVKHCLTSTFHYHAEVHALPCIDNEVCQPAETCQLENDIL